MKERLLPVLHYALSFLIIGFVVLALMDRVVMPLYVKHGQSIQLPDVREMPFDQAKQLLRSEGFEPVKEDTKFNPEYQAKTVIDQQPQPLSPVKTGRRVYLTISTREKFVEMPSLIGKTIRGAKLELNRVGVEVDTLYQTYSDTFPEGVISAQSVKEHGMIRMGSSVTLTVSKGRDPNEFIVPEVTGISLQDARERIREAGLSVGEIRYVQNQDLVPYTILKQSVEAGSTLYEQRPIDLVVSVLEMQDIFNQEMR